MPAGHRLGEGVEAAQRLAPVLRELKGREVVELLLRRLRRAGRARGGILSGILPGDGGRGRPLRVLEHDDADGRLARRALKEAERLDHRRVEPAEEGGVLPRVAAHLGRGGEGGGGEHVLRPLLAHRQQPHQQLPRRGALVGAAHGLRELLQRDGEGLEPRRADVGVAHRDADVGVVLRVAQQREDLVLRVGEHHVALVVELDDQVVLRRPGAARDADKAVGAKLLDLLDPLRAHVLPQLEREARRDLALVARKGSRVNPDARLDEQQHLRVGLRQPEDVRLRIDVVHVGNPVADGRLQRCHHRAHIERCEA